MKWRIETLVRDQELILTQEESVEKVRLEVAVLTAQLTLDRYLNVLLDQTAMRLDAAEGVRTRHPEDRG